MKFYLVSSHIKDRPFLHTDTWVNENRSFVANYFSPYFQRSSYLKNIQTCNFFCYHYINSGSRAKKWDNFLDNRAKQKKASILQFVSLPHLFKTLLERDGRWKFTKVSIVLVTFKLVFFFFWQFAQGLIEFEALHSAVFYLLYHEYTHIIFKKLYK